MQVYFATEGDGDAVVAQRLLTHAGLGIARSPGGLGGKARLDAKLHAYAQAARSGAIPWLILRDLDRDAPCPGDLVQKLVLDRPSLFVLRVAVRTIESWLLADDEGIASYLAVPRDKVPRQPEQLAWPKVDLVNLARLSRRADVRRDMVPEQGGVRPTGPGYTQRLVTFAREHWDPERARGRSHSLDRCVQALARLKAELSAG